MELDHPPFDAIILGCGLPESIAAASLAHAGKTVLHVDAEQNYGADYASLSLSELVDWARIRTEPADGSSVYLDSQRRRYGSFDWAFPSSSSSPTSRNDSLPDELKSLSRSFSLSLAPLLIPSVSPLIDTLVASGVSRYSTFRLLESTSIYEAGADQAKRVPGSKEDVFKDKSIGLKDKRGLMKVLLWILGEFEQSPELAAAPADETLLNFFGRAFSIPPPLAFSLSFALAHTSSLGSPALPALLRMRSYLRSVGKYGNSPFLVGQYGGAGEVVQGFARLAAVQGAIYILAQELESVELDEDKTAEHPVSVQIKGFSHPIKASQLIAHQDYLPSPPTPPSSIQPPETLARCIAIFDILPAFFPSLPPTSSDTDDGSEGKDRSPDTALLVFPPKTLVENVESTVQAILMGEGTGSAPKGHYVLYLTSPYPATSPSELFVPFLSALSPSHPPLFHLSYSTTLLPTPSSPHPSVHLTSTPQVAEVSLAMEEGARSAAEGERLFWAVFGKRDGEEEVGEGVEVERGFFEPRAEFDDSEEWAD